MRRRHPPGLDLRPRNFVPACRVMLRRLDMRAAAGPMLRATVAGLRVPHVSSSPPAAAVVSAAASTGLQARRTSCNSTKPTGFIGRSARGVWRAMSGPRAAAAAEGDQIIPFNLADIGEGITGDALRAERPLAERNRPQTPAAVC